MEINVAVVGVGIMGQNHARVYSELDDVNLVAVVDLDQTAGNAVADRFGCRFYSSLKMLMDKESVNAVSIAVPTSHHREVALVFLKKGIATFIEKPIANSSNAALDIINVAQKHKTQLMVGHIERFNPAVSKLKEVVSEGRLGEIVSITARRVGIAPPRIKDVSVIVDLAVHDIDVCNYLLGSSPDNIFAAGGRALINSREDYADLFLQYGKANAIIQVNWITPVKVRALNITGTEGYAELDYINQRLILYQANIETSFDDYGDFIVKFGSPVKKEIEIQKQEPLKLELAHFINSLRIGETPLVSGEEGLAVLESALEAEKMCKKGRG
jgi:UDP-N-acetylglucosamine 3-dehydrogenase